MGTMKEIYLISGTETIIILIIAIVINQLLHRFFAKRQLNFITPILNIFIVIWFLMTYHKAIEKISQMPNVRFPIEVSKLFLVANIIAGILIFVFTLQCIASLIQLSKSNKKEPVMEDLDDELPMFKPGVEFDLQEKEYPLPNNSTYKKCPFCDTENLEEATKCTACHAPFQEDPVNLPNPRQKLKRRQ